MQLIRELERTPRGIYTGVIGFISPHNSAVFNVAIRTLILKDGTAHMGVGGGIVADSTPAEEYRECLLKADFLTRSRQPFQLIETMLWQQNQLRFLDMHLDRLQSSAAFFDIPFDRANVLSQIIAATCSLKSPNSHRIRLLFDQTGNVTIDATESTMENRTASVLLSAEPVNSKNIFLRHKTTHRERYNSEYVQALGDGFDEVIFVNERGEITEGAISNIFVQQNGKLLTPPLSSGVLPGIYRRHLLETNTTAQEQVLTVQDLIAAEAIFLCNAIRGLRSVKSLYINPNQSYTFSSSKSEEVSPAEAPRIRTV
jgi:para-aminobenzoate synthetase / 4-amino-4-deoxychorismate lyase